MYELYTSAQCSHQVVADSELIYTTESYYLFELESTRWFNPPRDA